ncbi:hypothetical protein EVAR_84187_1 [Eumeta japonica]|uniref:Uncharacterized protein n=1 Tax=Eumeta variegata TaxID=151549 RepID=A0A4C1S7P6_EUMVA|nr:hypothetical protein EVAR_84187_1 [Eumeta japonica]
MAAEIKRTQDAIDRMDIPNKLEGPARHWRSSRPMRRLRQSRNCKRPRSRKFLAQRSPLPTPLSSRPDAPTTPVTRRSSSHASDDAIKRIETQKSLQVSKPEPSLPLIIIRDVLKVNSDAQIVESLKRQNGHTTEGLDWGKVEARVRYRRRARNPSSAIRSSRCRPRYTRLIKPATCMVAAATGLGPVASSAVLALSWFRP